jgi:hypothetical protein
MAGDAHISEPRLGLTVRDYFATRVMHALVSAMADGLLNGKHRKITFEGGIAAKAYEIADDMMKERG